MITTARSERGTEEGISDRTWAASGTAPILVVNVSIAPRKVTSKFTVPGAWRMSLRSIVQRTPVTANHTKVDAIRREYKRRLSVLRRNCLPLRQAANAAKVTRTGMWAAPAWSIVMLATVAFS